MILKFVIKYMDCTYKVRTKINPFEKKINPEQIT